MSPSDLITHAPMARGEGEGQTGAHSGGHQMKASEVQHPDGTLAPITVGELRRMLRGIPDRALVVLSSDAEQNQHHPLMTFATGEGKAGFGLYWHGNRWGGEVLDVHQGDTIHAGDQQCVLLVPMD